MVALTAVFLEGTCILTNDGVVYRWMTPSVSIIVPSYLRVQMSLFSALDGHFTPAKSPPPHSRPHSIGGWVSPRTCRNALEKRKITCPQWDSNLESSSSSPTSSTGWAIPDPRYGCIRKVNKPVKNLDATSTFHPPECWHEASSIQFCGDLWPSLLSDAFCSVHANWETFLSVKKRGATYRLGGLQEQ